MSGRVHRPEGWKIIKITPEGKPSFFKVFGSWRGGFADGDSWRMSSGADSMDTIEEKDEELTWPQSSGSTYVFYKGGQDRLGHYCEGVLKAVIENGEKQNCVVEVVEYK